MFITLIQLHIEINEWKKNDHLNQWMFEHITKLYVISVVCGSSFTAVQLCSSNLFGLTMFDLPLNTLQRSAFYTKRIYSNVFFEVNCYIKQKLKKRFFYFIAVYVP